MTNEKITPLDFNEDSWLSDNQLIFNNHILKILDEIELFTPTFRCGVKAMAFLENSPRFEYFTPGVGFFHIGTCRIRLELDFSLASTVIKFNSLVIMR